MATVVKTNDAKGAVADLAEDEASNTHCLRVVRHESACHSSDIRAWAYDPSRGQFATSDNKTVRLWSSEGEIRRVLVSGKDFVSLLVYNNIDDVYYAVFARNMIAVYSGDLEHINTFSAHEKPVIAMAAHPNTGELVTTALGGELKIWSFKKMVRPDTGDLILYEGKCRMSTMCKARWISRMAINERENVIYAADDSTVLVVSLTTGKSVARFTGLHTHAITCMTWVTELGLLFTASFDSMIRAWSIHQNACVLWEDFSGHTMPVNAIAVDPSTLCMTSCSEDGSVKLWDIRKSVLMDTLQIAHAAHFGQRRISKVTSLDPDDVHALLAWTPIGLICAPQPHSAVTNPVLFVFCGPQITLFEVTEQPRPWLNARERLLHADLTAIRAQSASEEPNGRPRKPGRRGELVTLGHSGILRIMDVEYGTLRNTYQYKHGNRGHSRPDMEDEHEHINPFWNPTSLSHHMMDPIKHSITAYGYYNDADVIGVGFLSGAVELFRPSFLVETHESDSLLLPHEPRASVILRDSGFSSAATHILLYDGSFNSCEWCRAMCHAVQKSTFERQEKAREAILQETDEQRAERLLLQRTKRLQEETIRRLKAKRDRTRNKELSLADLQRSPDSKEAVAMLSRYSEMSKARVMNVSANVIQQSLEKAARGNRDARARLMYLMRTANDVSESTVGEDRQNSPAKGKGVNTSEFNTIVARADKFHHVFANVNLTDAPWHFCMVSHDDGHVALWCAVCSKRVVMRAVSTRTVVALLPVPTRTLVIAVGADGNITALSKGELEIRGQFATLQESEVSTAALSMGTLLVLGTDDGDVSIKELKFDNNEMTTTHGGRMPRAHTGRITSIATSMHHSRVVSASVDDTIAIWDASTKQLLRSVPLLEHPAQQVFFINDEEDVILLRDGGFDIFRTRHAGLLSSLRKAIVARVGLATGENWSGDFSNRDGQLRELTLNDAPDEPLDPALAPPDRDSKPPSRDVSESIIGSRANSRRGSDASQIAMLANNRFVVNGETGELGRLLSQYSMGASSASLPVVSRDPSSVSPPVAKYAPLATHVEEEPSSPAMHPGAPAALASVSPLVRRLLGAEQEEEEVDAPIEPHHRRKPHSKHRRHRDRAGTASPLASPPSFLRGNAYSPDPASIRLSPEALEAHLSTTDFSSPSPEMNRTLSRLATHNASLRSLTAGLGGSALANSFGDGEWKALMSTAKAKRGEVREWGRDRFKKPTPQPLSEAFATLSMRTQDMLRGTVAAIERDHAHPSVRQPSATVTGRISPTGRTSPTRTARRTPKQGASIRDPPGARLASSPHFHSSFDAVAMPRRRMPHHLQALVAGGRDAAGAGEDDSDESDAG